MTHNRKFQHFPVPETTKNCRSITEWLSLREREMRCRETELGEQHQDDVGLEEPIKPGTMECIRCWDGS